MEMPDTEVRIRLRHDIPEFLLRRGDVGVVRGTRHQPSMAYAVDFFPLGPGFTSSVILPPDDVEPLPAEGPRATDA